MKKVFLFLVVSSLIFLSACSQKEENNINNDVDLTNCVSFFDGCNICSVEDGQITSCTTNVCGTTGKIEETKCLKTVEELEAQKNLSGKDSQ